MQLDEYLMRTHGFENINLPRVLISEGQVSINGKKVTTAEFPVTSQDEVTLRDAVLAKRTVHYWNMRRLLEQISLRVTDDFLCFGVEDDEIDALRERNHSTTLVLLPHETEKPVKAGDVLFIHPFQEAIAKHTKRRYNGAVFGTAFDPFRIAKIVEMNRETILPHSTLIVKIKGEAAEAEGQRQALLAFADALKVEEQLFYKSPYGRHFSWLVLRKR